MIQSPIISQQSSLLTDHTATIAIMPSLNKHRYIPAGFRNRKSESFALLFEPLSTVHPTVLQMVIPHSTWALRLVT